MPRSDHDLPALRRDVEYRRRELERCGSLLRSIREDMSLADIALTTAAKRYDEAVVAYQDAKAEVENGSQEA